LLGNLPEEQIPKNREFPQLFGPLSLPIAPGSGEQFASDSHPPSARIAIYPFKRVFEVAETTTNVKSVLAETCFLPSPDTKERETWYINMGVSMKEMFTLQALVDAAH
jgi:hypothetical protein